MWQAVVDWVFTHWPQLGLTALVLAGYLALRRVALPWIERSIDATQLKEMAHQRARIALGVLSGVLSATLLLFIWGFDFRGLLAFSTGLIALTGAALFASWSILSNITAFFLLLLNPSFQRGNFIRVIDGDNYVEGYVADLTLFNTRLISEAREVILYPNNLLLARPTLINPRQRFSVIGKTEEFAADAPGDVAAAAQVGHTSTGRVEGGRT